MKLREPWYWTKIQIQSLETSTWARVVQWIVENFDLLYKKFLVSPFFSNLKMSVSCIHIIFFGTVCISYCNSKKIYLSFWVLLVSLSITVYSCFSFGVKVRISFFLWLSIIPLCICASFSKKQYEWIWLLIIPTGMWKWSKKWGYALRSICGTK